MSWSPLQLGGISFISPHKPPASLEFREGLNVVRGASDTGKSFLVEAIDFLLGAKVDRNNNPLRDIPQRDGYDRARLILRARDNEVFTLQRSTSGGSFNRFEGAWLINEPNVEAINLSEVHEHGNHETLSTYLLSLIGLENKRVQKNRQGETQSLSFRNLVRLVVIQEDDIIKRNSPILSRRNQNATVEYSVFRLLLTGVDDSALVEQARIQSEIVTTRQNNRAKLEFITELIQEQQSELESFQTTRTQAEERISFLEDQLQRQQEILAQFQQNLNSRIERRREISESKEILTTRINEISSLLSRFDLLKKHYRIDLERLTSIEESGSLFVYLERTPCPLCGALPNEHHQVEMCDGDIENVINAAAVEIAKVQQLSEELDQTATTVNSRVDLSTSVLDDFAETVQRLLQAWNFPGSDRVSFDEAKKDLVIGGQPRTSRGKGLRAVTHSAMTIGLMDFCKERNLSHPGFVVLDSPLLAYWQPEASEDKALLEGVGVRENFYEYLASNYNDSQILIIENEPPPDGIEERVLLTNFTGNPNEGRYGFFPAIED